MKLMNGIHKIKTKKEVRMAANYSTFINITGTQTVDKFRKTKEFVSGENEYFISLFLVWEFSGSYEKRLFHDTADVKMQHMDNPLATSRRIQKLLKEHKTEKTERSLTTMGL